MNKIWYKELGFFNNPFSIKPAAFHDQAIGYEKVVDEISYGILNKKVVLVDGDYGNGKSTILKRLLNDFGGKKQVIYYSCNRIDGRLDVKELLNGRYGFIGKWFDLKPKDMILLLDEAQELDAKDYERIYPYYQEGYIQSVVLMGNGIKKDSIIGGLKSQLEVAEMGKLNEDLAVLIIRKRIGDVPVLSDSIIRKVYQKTGDNIRILLKTCEDLCKSSVDSGRRKVTEDFVKQYFQEKDEKKEVKEEKIEVKPKKEPIIIDKRNEKLEEKEHKEDHKEEKKEDKKKGGKVYKPEEYKGLMRNSAEELLNKSTDEIFGDEQYY
jgi:hypothetical protein